MTKKTLLFEGAGWDKAESSIKSGVGNCRIRTRIRNNDGRLIYLEMGGFEVSKKEARQLYRDYNIASHIDHCFYCDSEWDSRRSHSTELNPLLRERFEYTKENILKFVNDNLNCSFDNVEIDNSNSLNVHNTEEPLCDCSLEGYTPYREIKYNVSELNNIKPILDCRDRGHSQYKISYDLVKELPYIKEWMDQRESREQKQFPNYNYYANLRWDNNGDITSLEISARQNFGSFGIGRESIRIILDDIKRVGKKDVIAVC